MALAIIGASLPAEEERSIDPPRRDRSVSYAPGESRPEIIEMDDVLYVDGFPLLPLGRISTGGGSVEWHPKGLVGAKWDSNPLLATEGSAGDAVGLIGVGLNGRVNPEGQWSGEMDALVVVNEYMDTDGRSYPSGTARGRIDHHGRSTHLGVAGGWWRDSEPVAAVPDMVDREQYDLSVFASRAGRQDLATMRVGWSDLNYLEDSIRFDRDARDLQKKQLSVTWLRMGGSGSSLGVEANAEEGTRNKNSPANGYDGGTLLARWRHPLGGRSSVEIRAGSTLRSYDSTSPGQQIEDDQLLIAPAVSLRGEWGWEDRSFVVLQASTDLVDSVSVSPNAAIRYALETWARWRLLDRCEFVATGFLVRRLDSAPSSGGSEALTLDDLFISAGIDYRMRDGIGLKTWASWLQTHPSLGDGYGRSLVGVELVAAF
jgi:hypothetical protein